MHKLKLESLQVESFETIPAPPNSRGTVQGHDVSETGEPLCVWQMSDEGTCPQTWDFQLCPDTQYLDCTMGCTDFDSCIGPCEFK